MSTSDLVLFFGKEKTSDIKKRLEEDDTIEICKKLRIFLRCGDRKIIPANLKRNLWEEFCIWYDNDYQISKSHLSYYVQGNSIKVVASANHYIDRARKFLGRHILPMCDLISNETLREWKDSGKKPEDFPLFKKEYLNKENAAGAVCKLVNLDTGTETCYQFKSMKELVERRTARQETNIQYLEKSRKTALKVYLKYFIGGEDVDSDTQVEATGNVSDLLVNDKASEVNVDNFIQAIREHKDDQLKYRDEQLKKPEDLKDHLEIIENIG